MAEIYSSSDAASNSTLSAEDFHHVQRVLAHLGVPSDSGTATQADTGADGGTATAGSDASEGAAHANAIDTGASDTGTHATSFTSGDGDDFRISGLGDDTLAGGGHSPPTDNATASDAATPSHDGTSATGLADTADAGGHATTSGHDTLAGGNGMDTLWGSGAPPPASADAPAPSDTHAGAASGDTGLTAAGSDTLHGAHPAFGDAGDPAQLHAGADTLAAHQNHDTLDASTSPHAGTTDVSGTHSTIIGGAGDDTLALHDGSGSAAWSHEASTDHAFADPSGAHAASASSADPTSSWNPTESVIGGDGSDIYAMSYYAGYDTTDAGSAGHDGTDYSVHAFADPHFAPDGTTIVTFGDGYGAHPSGAENIQFHDTVYNI